jgi:hypothetical protein
MNRNTIPCPEFRSSNYSYLNREVSLFIPLRAQYNSYSALPNISSIHPSLIYFINIIQKLHFKGI